jgi:hypothetical protein
LTGARAIAAALAVAACGCGGGPGLTGFRQQENALECDVIFRCCTAAVQALYGADASACNQTLNSRIDTTLGEDSIAKGKTKYDSGLAQQCLDAQRAAFADCDAPLAPIAPDPCPRVTVGTIADQGSCDQRVKQCVPGEFCLSTNPAPAPGACQRQSQQNESCADVTCVDGLACDANLVCITPIPDGQGCAIGAECASHNCVGMICMPVPTVRLAICH